jgi:hypothetical protein
MCFASGPRPKTAKQKFKVGDVVGFSREGKSWNFKKPAKTAAGTVVGFPKKGGDYIVKVLFDGYKRPHTFHISFISKRRAV